MTLFTQRLCVAITTCMFFFSGASMAATHAKSKKPEAVAAAPAKNKVVFQVSDGDPKKWGLALNNVKNVQEALGKENVTIELVAYGPGIGMLKFDSEMATRITDAVAAGAKIVACEVTMKGQHLTPADMHPDIGYVPGGVIELMKLQRDGYAYIRP